MLLAACKKAITKRWYKSDPPTRDEWLKLVSEISVMEWLTLKIRVQEDQCANNWGKWTVFTSQRQEGV